MKVNVLEAKNRLSELIRAAQAGEEVIIANRGQAVARLSPIQEPMSGAVVGSAKALLNWLEKSSQPGWMQRSAADINADIEQERGAWD
jgi:prevent-host-death family protein